jgi:lysozyme
MILRRSLVDSVKEHEGFRARAYRDHLGHWTIGYGTNLEVMEIDDQTAENWLVVGLVDVAATLESVQGFGELDSERQDILIEMGYQLGVAGLMRFRLMWQYLRARDYDRAADEMLDSLWAREQTPERAQELADRMRPAVGPTRNGHP